jgi:hypothetical protein
MRPAGVKSFATLQSSCGERGLPGESEKEISNTGSDPQAAKGMEFVSEKWGRKGKRVPILWLIGGCKEECQSLNEDGTAL